MLCFFFFFFFQAEDGIRDADVTGVQTCALPISDKRVLDNVLGELRSAGETEDVGVQGGLVGPDQEFRGGAVAGGGLFDDPLLLASVHGLPPLAGDHRPDAGASGCTPRRSAKLPRSARK